MSAADPTADSRITINGHVTPVQEWEIGTLHVAIVVRMLHRNDLDHERICTLGRDRIMWLMQEVERLAVELEALRPEAEKLTTSLRAIETAIGTDRETVTGVENECGMIAHRALRAFESAEVLAQVRASLAKPGATS